MAAPNQKIVQARVKQERSKANPYAMMNIEALKQAMINLNGNSGLLLWLYLNKNDDKYFPTELSQKASEAWGIKKDSYYRAVEELIAKGYLVCGEGSNLYTFYEVPVSQNAKEAGKQISDSAKEISQSEKDPSHGAIEPSHQPQRKNTENTIQNTIKGAEAQPPAPEAEAEGNYPTIDESTYNSLCSKVQDLGGGLIKLENGRIFKRTDGKPFSQPLAYLAEQKSKA